MNRISSPYQALCSEFYDLDKPNAPDDALQWYLKYVKEAEGCILEPMCGTGRFTLPLLEMGYPVVGFDDSDHMLEICRKKACAKGLTAQLIKANFDTFSLPGSYNLVFIPSGSFCLLIQPRQVVQALKFVYSHLNQGGKFVFEIETIQARSDLPGIWKGKSIKKADGSKIILSILPCYDELSSIENMLCRYELWENNHIVHTEVEDFQIKLYNPLEIEDLLIQQKFKIVGKWQAAPYTKKAPTDSTAVIVYECIKD